MVLKVLLVGAKYSYYPSDDFVMIKLINGLAIPMCKHIFQCLCCILQKLNFACKFMIKI